jgi:linoleate 10R-lipoxygenase
MTRAVLGDAIALIRGDRFYTTDFSREFSVYISDIYSMVSVTAASILTTWGYQDTQRDPNNGGFGGECKNDVM